MINSGISNNPIKTFKTEKEAINFAIKNTGSEAIIKEKKDKFSSNLARIPSLNPKD